MWNKKKISIAKTKNEAGEGESSGECCEGERKWNIFWGGVGIEKRGEKRKGQTQMGIKPNAILAP